MYPLVCGWLCRDKVFVCGLDGPVLFLQDAFVQFLRLCW